MYVVDANQTQYMALQLDPDRYQEAERLYEETWTYIESGSEADLPVPMQVTGRLTLMEDPDLVAYYEDMFGGEVSADEVSYWMLEDGLLEAGQPGTGTGPVLRRKGRTAAGGTGSAVAAGSGPKGTVDQPAGGAVFPEFQAAGFARRRPGVGLSADHHPPLCRLYPCGQELCPGAAG